MARRKRPNRRHRGSGFRFLYRLLSMLVICACLIAAVTLFFKVETIRITGQDRYREEEILAASEIELGDNLFLLNKFDAAKKISEKLPYIDIENVLIHRKLPDTLLIEVKECGEPLAILQDGAVWLVGYTGKIVEQTTSADGYTILEGVELISPSVGTAMSFGSEYAYRLESALSLLDALETSGKRDQVQAIHLGNSAYLTMDFMDRFTIKMTYDANFAYKLKEFDAIMEKGTIQPNMKGTFDMRRKDEMAVFHLDQSRT